MADGKSTRRDVLKTAAGTPPGHSVTTSVLIHDGRFVAVGTAAASQACHPRTINLRGKAVPGAAEGRPAGQFPQENDLGPTEAGNHAGLVVLNSDYPTVDEEQTTHISPVLTMVAGDIVHDTGELTGHPK